MQKLTIDVDVNMKDVDPQSPNSDKSDVTYGTCIEGDGRSPRTPTYAPTSPVTCSVAPFDPSRILSLSERTNTSNSSQTQPTDPLAWIWQCHLCKSRYPLRVTRRCLVDGHFYCSGETDRPNLRKRKGQSCSSEFDYVGWREWGEWKRTTVLELLRAGRPYKIARGCEKCQFPSQCRHDKARNSLSSSCSFSSSNSFEDIELKSPATTTTTTAVPSKTGEEKPNNASESVTFDSIFAKENNAENTKAKTDTDSSAKSPSPNDKSKIASTVVTVDRVAKSPRRKSARSSPLSPIREEFFPTNNADSPVKSSLGQAILRELRGFESSFKKYDRRMDLD